MKITELLKSSALFKDAKEIDLEKVAVTCTERMLSPGETLFFEGEVSSSLFLLASGTINIKKASSKGEEAVTSIAQGSHFGELALLNREGGLEKRSAMAEAGEASVIVEVPFTPLLKYIDSSPAFGLLFYRNVAVTLASRIRRTTEDLAGLRALRLRHT